MDSALASSPLRSEDRSDYATAFLFTTLSIQ
jgi:hypothetical protein